jgi:hypothetical protein
MTSRNAEFLLGHVRGAIEAVAGGIEYSAGDQSAWGVSDQSIDGRPTGKIIVACGDAAALNDLKTTLKRLGHTVEPGRSLSTGQEVPNTLLITPAR